MIQLDSRIFSITIQTVCDNACLYIEGLVNYTVSLETTNKMCRRYTVYGADGWWSVVGVSFLGN